MQEQFTVSSNGRVTDLGVTSVVERLIAEFPGLDESPVEAHFTLSRAAAVYHTALSERYEDLGISPARFNLLRHLYYAESQRLSMSELGAYLNVSVPNVLRMVQALDGEGWTSSAKDSTDRRVTMVQLTQAGLERFTALLPEVIKVWEGLWAGLSTEEAAQLSELLAKLRKTLLDHYLHETGLMRYRLQRSRTTKGQKQARQSAGRKRGS
jgi:DNA-binding MarR family transcriptional regulator